MIGATPISTGYSHESVERVVNVLNVFTGVDPLPLAEIARRALLNDATTLRYVTSLCRHGLIERDEASGRYRLGIRLFELGQRALLGRDPRRLARPYMEQLHARFAETINLATRYGDELILIEVLESQQSIKKGATVGEKDHWHASSLGKAILAHLPHNEAEKILASAGLRALTVRTLTKSSELFKQLEVVRRRGYAVDDEETLTELRCVGAPILDQRGTPAYALSVAGPKNRIPARRLREIGAAVSVAAIGLSRELGYEARPAGELVRA